MRRQTLLIRLTCCALLAGIVSAPLSDAWGQQAPHGTGLDDAGGPGGMGMDMGNPPPPPPGSNGERPRPQDPLANLPHPLTTESVRRALEDYYSRRPHVGRVADLDANTLSVEVVMPDGRSMTMSVDKQTGARHPLR